MAVTMAGNSFDLMKLFGVSPDLIEKAKSVGVTAEYKNQHIHIYAANGKTTATVWVKGTAISVAKSGQMGPTAMEAIRYSVTQGLNHAIKLATENDDALNSAYAAPAPSIVPLPPGVPDHFPLPPPLPHKPNLLDKFKKKDYPKPNMSAAEKAAWTKKQQKLEAEAVKKAVSENIAPVFMPDKDIVDFKSIFSESPVPLALATKVYQPVNGTSNRYYVVAMAPGVNIAARRKGDGEVAFRAEGPALANYMPRLNQLGFDMKTGYASVHLKLGSASLQKTYGALLGVLGINHLLKVGEIMVLPK